MEPPAGDALPVPTADYEPAPMDSRERRFTIPWEWWDALTIYFLWVIMAGGAAALVAGAFDDPASEASTAVGVLVAVILLAITVMAWIGFRGDRQGVGDAIRRAFGVARPRLADVGLGIAWGLAAFVVVQLGLGLALTTVIDALGREVPTIQEGVQEAAQASGLVPILTGLGVVLLGPLGEELLYRGVLYQGLAKHMPAWPAIGLSGLAFGITHVEPFVIALTFPLGMLLAWTMRRYGTLVVPTVAHIVFNSIGFALIRAGEATGA